MCDPVSQADSAEINEQEELAASIRSALLDKEVSYLRSLTAQAKGLGMGRYRSV